MKTCEYQFRNRENCGEEAQHDSKYCILHIDLPDVGSEDFERINRLKEEKVKEKVENGDFNFEGVKLLEVDFSDKTIRGDLIFSDTVIKKDVLFIEAVLEYGTYLRKCNVYFNTQL